MSTRRFALFTGVLGIFLAGTALLATPRHTRVHRGTETLLAQRGPHTCSTDANCAIAHPPAPRACPGGGQSVASGCCRMNYCGICWTDCPSTAGGH